MKVVGIPYHKIQSNPKLYNSNNHWNRSEKGTLDRPDDYIERLEKTFTSKWIDKFHSNYYTFEIQKKDFYWMREAYKIGKFTGSFTKMFEEELEDAISTYKDVDEYLSTIERGVFVRSENVSLKYGVNGLGPYKSVKSILESAVSSSPTHTPFNEDTTHLKFYLLPWKDINEDYEFRVFVYDNKITGISQQKCYSVAGFKGSELGSIIKRLLDSFENDIKHKINLSEYSYDVALLEDHKVYFIEINGFGKEYAAGSSLFHWLRDEDVLYGKREPQFRYVTQQ